jgi:hypothetical protein
VPANAHLPRLSADRQVPQGYNVAILERQERAERLQVGPEAAGPRRAETPGLFGSACG